MSSVNVKDVFEKIENAALCADDSTRYIRAMVVGQIIRQGDIYITRLEDSAPCGPETEERQLVAGVSIGSRHLVSGDVTVYVRNSKNPLEGPYIRMTGDKMRIEHPEHAHVVVFQGGLFGVTYQRDFASEERARVVD